MARKIHWRRKANNMTKLVTLTLTDSDCLSLRCALNATAMEWGDKASAARKAGDDVDAATCERIRSDYHRLWDVVNEAQEARGRVKDWIYRQPSPDARLAWFDDGAHTGAWPDSDIDASALPGRAPGTFFREAAPPATCCQFHMSGGERDLSCGGDDGADYVARCEKLAHKPEARPIGTDPVDVLNAIDRLKGW
jgi:hypothetical protein